MLKERQALWLGEAWALRDFYYQQSRKRQQSYRWEQLVLVNNEATSPSREQIRGEIINDGEKLSSSYKTAGKGPPLLNDLGGCRG